MRGVTHLPGRKSPRSWRMNLREPAHPGQGNRPRKSMLRDYFQGRVWSHRGSLSWARAGICRRDPWASGRGPGQPPCHLARRPGAAGPRCSGRCRRRLSGRAAGGHPVNDDPICQISPVTQPRRLDQAVTHLAQTNFKAIHYLTSSEAQSLQAACEWNHLV